MDLLSYTFPYTILYLNLRLLVSDLQSDPLNLYNAFKTSVPSKEPPDRSLMVYPLSITLVDVFLIQLPFRTFLDLFGIFTRFNFDTTEEVPSFSQNFLGTPYDY